MPSRNGDHHHPNACRRSAHQPSRRWRCCPRRRCVLDDRCLRRLWDVVHDDLGTADWIANLGITLFAIPLIILGPTSGRLQKPFRIGGAGLLAGAFFMFMYSQLPDGNWIFAFTMGHALTDALSISASGVAVAMAVPEEREAGAKDSSAQTLAGGLTAGAIGAI